MSRAVAKVTHIGSKSIMREELPVLQHQRVCIDYAHFGPNDTFVSHGGGDVSFTVKQAGKIGEIQLRHPLK